MRLKESAAKATAPITKRSQGFSPGSASYFLSDFGEDITPTLASVYSPIKWDGE